MTLHSIFQKLRNNNRGSYRLLCFCLTFAIFLISSFSSVLFSDFIQNILPDGGDSGKQVIMIFIVALIGCLLFAIYAVSLFLKYKGKEIGVFLSLGAVKKQLSASLFLDLGKMLCGCFAAGLILGNLSACLICVLFRNFLPDPSPVSTGLSGRGILTATLFSLLLAFSIGFMTVRFMKRTNILDILNERHKTEKLPRMITPRYGIIGAVLTVAGILLGYTAPALLIRLTHRNLSGIFNLFYLLSLCGIYMMTVYSVGCHRRGRHPGRYYRNLIAYGMMKLQGAQIVKNMCVITLLIAGGLFAAFYIPATYTGMLFAGTAGTTDYTLYYPMDSGEIGQEEIEALAYENNVEITDYEEVIYLSLAASGIVRDYDEADRLTEDYVRELYLPGFLRVSEFNRISGMELSVRPGTYKIITSGDMTENIWYQFDDLDHVLNMDSGFGMPLSYGGKAEYVGLVIKRGFDRSARYVLSDSDYEKLAAGASDSRKQKQILFNVADPEGSYSFAEKLYAAFSKRASSEMKVLTNYDALEEQTALSETGHYSYAGTIELHPDQPLLKLDWKYAPEFKVLNARSVFLNFAVLFLLFAYVAVICLAAAGMIAYTRSLSVGTANQKVFEDIRRLGADDAFLQKSIGSQLHRIYVLPAITGSLSMIGFHTLILWQNDGVLRSSELLSLLISLGICAAVLLYLYLMYKISYREVKKIVLI